MRTLQECTGIMPGDIPEFDQLRQQYGNDYLEKMSENDKSYLLYQLVFSQYGNFDIDQISDEFDSLALRLPKALPDNARIELIQALITQLKQGMYAR